MSEPQGAQDRITAFLRREGIDDGWDEDYANEVAGLILDAATGRGLDARIERVMSKLYKDGGAEPIRTSLEYEEVEAMLRGLAAAQQREGAGE